MSDYPAARRGDVVETLHGVRVADPYRWLEELESEETRAWVAAQAEHAEAWLAEVPARAEITEQLTGIWDRPTEGVPLGRAGQWFQWRNSGLQGQPVLYRGDSVDAIDHVLLDPNLLSPDSTVAVTAVAVSRDASMLAWAASEAGSDWLTWRVRDVATGVDLPDLVALAKFSGAAWLPDGSGFCYMAPDAPTVGAEFVEDTGAMRLLLHRIGTPAEDDELVYAVPDEPSWFPDAALTEDGHWLVVTVTRGTDPQSQVHVRPALDTQAPFSPLVPDMATTAGVVGSEGETFFLLTDDGAELGRVVALELATPERAAWRELIPARDARLLEVVMAGGRFVCHWLRDAASELTVHDLSGAPVAVLEVEPATTVSAISGHPGEPLLHWTTTSAADPGTLHRHDLRTAATESIRRTRLGVDLAPVVSEQVFVTSADGTKVPVFLTHRADVEASGEVPAIVYGYGGFDHPMTPVFDPTWALWVERGGLVAVACLRGGGEYGEGWHDAGRLRHKENVFDDACAVASWLHTSGWSRPSRIALNGRSNGGLLVAACLTRHPELFGAFVPQVGVLDMLRFHLFTIGWAWKTDYGDPDVAADFEVLLRYSPLHNVEAGVVLPPVLLTTGDHDDRVVPSHSFKFAATLQATATGGPFLLRVDLAAGHGAGKPTAKLLAERADLLAFLERALEVGARS